MDSIKKLSTKKVQTVDFSELNLKVNSLGAKIYITRTKHDPGAAHILVETKGGVLAILRYAYGEKAEKFEDNCRVFELKAAHNNAYLVIGSYSGELDSKKCRLMDDLFEILETNKNIDGFFQHDVDGFLKLRQKYSWNNFGNTVFGDDPNEGEHYLADLQIDCHGIRDNKDEPVIALVNAVMIWANKSDIRYNLDMYPMFSYGNFRSAYSAMMRSPEFCEAIRLMDQYNLKGQHVETFTNRLAGMFESLEDLRASVAVRGSRRDPRRRPPYDDYDYDF